jgi:hypothetical protein
MNSSSEDLENKDMTSESFLLMVNGSMITLDLVNGALFL